MNAKIKRLEKKRTRLLTEAAAFKQADGSFKDEQARAAFDAKTTEIEQLDTQIRALQAEAAAADPDEDDDDDLPADAVTVERRRCIDIRQASRAAQLGDELADEHIRKGTTGDAFRTIVIDKLAESHRTTRTDNTLDIVPGEDARDKFFRGGANWLLVKGGCTDLITRAAKARGETTTPALDPGEFRGMSLLELARYCLEMNGVKTRGLDKMTLVARAFTYRSNITQSTADFPILLENVMHRTLQAAYATQPDTWSRWCYRGTVSDFRPHNRYRMGMFGRLDNLGQNGEFKRKPILDAEKALISASTVGNIINVSRQMIVNDDMSAFIRLLTMLGRAARMSVEIDAYAELLKNSGLGPTQGDGQPLFHANRANVGAGAALAVEALDADRVVMAQQKDPWGNEFLDLRPAVLLVPIVIGGTARVINDAQYDPDTANKLQRPNKVRGLFRDIVDTPRLTGTRRYLFADPNNAPVFEVAFLEGQTEPVVESKDGWNVDGTEMKVRFDYGVKDVDFRGAVTNAGA